MWLRTGLACWWCWGIERNERVQMRGYPQCGGLENLCKPVNRVSIYWTRERRVPAGDFYTGHKELTMSRWLLALLFAFGTVTFLTGCPAEEDTDTEDAVEAVEDAADDAADAVGDAADDAADAVSE